LYDSVTNAFLTNKSIYLGAEYNKNTFGSWALHRPTGKLQCSLKPPSWISRIQEGKSGEKEGTMETSER